jgi:cytochrome b6
MFSKQVTDSKVYQWFEERLEIQALADDITSKYVPPHVNIFYCLGGITLVCFLIQFATGFAMTFYYKPTVTEAFSSVEYIMNEVSFGWLIRSVHRWSASMMVLMMILHVFRVYLTGGFKKPRELTWVTGVIMAVITVSFGVTGYSLPWDQVGYWAVKIVSGVPAAIPVVGDLAYLCFPLVNGGLHARSLPDDPQTGNFWPVINSVNGEQSIISKDLIVKTR